MSLPETHYKAVSLSADGIVKTGPGFLGRVHVTASAAGVIRLYDSTSASGTVIIDQLAVTAASNFTFTIEFFTGLYFDLVSGTATVTITFL
jgi:hypothetical protein